MDHAEVLERIEASVASPGHLLALELDGSDAAVVLRRHLDGCPECAAEWGAWRVVEESFAPARPPSTLLGVAALGYPGQLVEIEAVALASA